MNEEFAERAERRLKDAADRLEEDAGALGIDGEASKTKARVGELRVAALLVRGEAVSAASASAGGTGSDPAGPPPLRAQG